MTMDHLILYMLYAMTFISFAFIPKNKRKKASIAFLFQQGLSWALGLLVVELHLIEYPVRELNSVNRTSFLYEFLVFPTFSAFYYIYYPQKKKNVFKILYTGAFSTGITVPEVIFEKYTNLIHYLHWGWYTTWFSVFVSLSLLWIFYKWYFRIDNKDQSAQD